PKPHPLMRSFGILRRPQQCVRMVALALLAVCLCGGVVNRAPAAPPKAAAGKNSFLILVARNPSDPWAVSQVEGMLRFFQEQTPVITPAIEYMDWQNGPAQKQEARLSDYYAEKFAGRKFRVVIAQGPQAVSFLVKFRDRLFPDAQGVFCGVRKAE